MKLIIQITKGFIHDQSSRRMAMFVTLLAALVALFAGTTFLSSWLSENPFYFLGYWGACAWLVIAAALLAIFDLIMVRAQIQREKRRLREEIFGKKHDDE